MMEEASARLEILRSSENTGADLLWIILLSLSVIASPAPASAVRVLAKTTALTTFLEESQATVELLKDVIQRSKHHFNLLDVDLDSGAGAS